MVAIHENRETVRQAHPVRLSCKFVVEDDLRRACQALGNESTYRGVPVGTISTMHPWGALREIALREAQQFVRHMADQNYDLLGDVTELALWGPYMEKIDHSRSHEFVIQDGSDWEQVVGKKPLERHNAVSGFGYRENEVRFDLGAAYLLHGQFLARYGHLEEERGVLIV